MYGIVHRTSLFSELQMQTFKLHSCPTFRMASLTLKSYRLGHLSLQRALLSFAPVSSSHTHTFVKPQASFLCYAVAHHPIWHRRIPFYLFHKGQALKALYLRGTTPKGLPHIWTSMQSRKARESYSASLPCTNRHVTIFGGVL